jgi:polysaccharide export outer membrane protein
MWTPLALLIVIARAGALAPDVPDQSRVAAGGVAPVVSGREVPAPPAGYTIGPDDRLSIVFWKDTELSADVVVRPDGRISLPLINDIQAAGLTPDELRERVLAAAVRFIKTPDATVVVKEIHSRRVFITGNVDKPGAYPLNTSATVLQLIATAGGLREFVAGKNIVVVRSDGSRLKFNYQDVIRGKNLAQNIELRPGDTVIVP